MMTATTNTIETKGTAVAAEARLQHGGSGQLGGGGGSVGSAGGVGSGSMAVAAFAQPKMKVEVEEKAPLWSVWDWVFFTSS